MIIFKYNWWIFALSLALLASCGTQRTLKKQQRYMDNVYNELKTALPEAEVTIVRDTVKVLFPEHLLFEVNSATIKEENYSLMERLAKTLNNYQRTSILINGYTDISGSIEVNNRLSKERAQHAESALQKSNVDSGRLFVWGHGSSNPIANNDSPEGRRKNRRVEFIVLYNYKHVE